MEDFFLFLLPFFIFLFYFFFIKKPTNNKDWKETLLVFPKIEITKTRVEIKSVRHFKHYTKKDYKIKYIDEIYNLNELESLIYYIEPFTRFNKGIAHNFFEFKFKTKSVIISIEARKTKKQEFNPITAMFNIYELMYVIGTKNDILTLRKDIRGNDIREYKLKTTKEFRVNLFLDMLKRAKKIQKNPEFYSPFFNSCSTNLVDHVNKFLNVKIKKDLRVIFPGYSDSIIKKLNLNK